MVDTPKVYFPDGLILSNKEGKIYNQDSKSTIKSPKVFGVGYLTFKTPHSLRRISLKP